MTMRPLLPLCLVAALELAGAARADTRPEPPARARIVLTFANPAPPASSAPGSSAARYGGTAYAQGQLAHALARRVARQYGLKEVASWPIQALAVHCVVYEVSPGTDVPTLLARLRQDTRVALVQPMQDFHALAAVEPRHEL